MMDRSNKYVSVTEREWAEYQRAPLRSVEKRVLHIKIFYGERTLKEAGQHFGFVHVVDSTRVVDVLHPLPYGSIPEGYALGEECYKNETKWVVRSERETEKTESNSRGMSL